jgi:hypothetical protein
VLAARRTFQLTTRMIRSSSPAIHNLYEVRIEWFADSTPDLAGQTALRTTLWT